MAAAADKYPTPHAADDRPSVLLIRSDAVLPMSTCAVKTKLPKRVAVAGEERAISGGDRCQAVGRRVCPGRSQRDRHLQKLMLALTKTLGHSPKAGLVVTMMEMRSERRLIRWNRS